MARDIFSILSRVGAVTVPLVVIASSIATVKIIDYNEDLVKVRDYNDTELNKELQDLQSLIISTQAAANWAFVLCGITFYAGFFSTVIFFVNEQPTGRLIMGIIEMILACLGMLCFLSLGITSAVHAYSWRGPLDACEKPNELTKKDFCDNVLLSVTNIIQAGLSFIEILILGAEFLMTKLIFLWSRPVATTTSSTTTSREIS